MKVIFEGLDNNFLPHLWLAGLSLEIINIGSIISSFLLCVVISKKIIPPLGKTLIIGAENFKKIVLRLGLVLRVQH